MEGPSEPPSISEPDEDDTALANSEFLTRQEVLKRRSRRLSRLAKCYRDHYWSLMEELKRKHREYYWKFGKSPFREEDEVENGAIGVFVNNSIDNDNNRIHHNDNDKIVTSSGDLGLELGIEGSFNRCAFPGCNSKAMALTRYCHPHILSDTNQKLYKGCKFCIKSTGAGPIICGKPILISTIPSLCPSHLQKAERNLRVMLKKEGVPVALSNRLGSKFHLVITEFVHQIQSRRRAAAAACVNADNMAIEDGITSRSISPLSPPTI